jgi:hypothetical protein
VPASSLVIRNLKFQLGQGILQAIRAHKTIIIAVTAFYAAGIIARYHFLGPQAPWPSLYIEPFRLLIALFVIIFFVGHALYIMIWNRPAQLTAYILSDLRDNYLTSERLAQGVLILLLMHPFLATFSFFKTLIPIIQPFYLDEFFMELDRFLHLDKDPWLWLQPILGIPIITFATNFLYNLWFFILFGIVFWQAFYRNNLIVRQQFFLSFFTLWIGLGFIVAVILSSAGPVYYGRVTGLPDPYSPLMAYLNSANESYTIWSLKTQDMLWASYQKGIAFAGSGISAMPSLHVATTTLFALLGWKSNRVLGTALTIFALSILLGSIHLGWHYAVDGYLAIAFTCSIWWGFGKILKAAPNKMPANQ